MQATTQPTTTTTSKFQNDGRLAREWSTRPADERFWNARELLDATTERFNRSSVARMTLRRTEFVQTQNRLGIVGPKGIPLSLNFHSFGKLAGTLSAPASYLASLPADLAAQCLNESKSTLSADDLDRERVGLVLSGNGAHELRGLTSERYSRVWDREIAEFLVRLQDAGWKVPPGRRPMVNGIQTRAATKDDVIDGMSGGMQIGVGDQIAPSGLYLSKKDVFGFLVEPSRAIDDGVSPLFRALMISQSEVQDQAIELSFIYLRGVCGNHLLWGVGDESRTVRIIHTGNARDKWEDAGRRLRAFADGSTEDDVRTIKALQVAKLGDSADEIATLLHQKKITTRKNALAAIDSTTSERGVDGDPFTAWGVMNGLTRVSQGAAFADERADLDRAAGRVPELVFA